MKRVLFLLILVLSFQLQGYAKHITGGEMRYEFLRSTSTSKTYRITLVLFRDENCGTNCAEMPADVLIGIYNNDNNDPYGGAGTLPTNLVSLLRIETLSLTNIPLCLTNVPALNYTAGYYSLVVSLNNNAKGYTAAYQTCCRIENINNIDNGTNGAGATYTTVIPGLNNLSAAQSDNSPIFSTGISVICHNNEFKLDFSATDADGDQLVYSLCNAYNGGAAQNSANITPSTPPYGSVIYTGGFTGSLPMGLQAVINTQTGIISGIAPESGKYVVSVCVSSYRNGNFIATHRKDFIVTVADCDVASAELFPEYITCDGSSFTFSNRSQSPLNQSFYWDFGDPASGANNTSTSPSPTHVFTTAGDYNVKFVVNRGTGCADSTFSLVKVYPGYFPAYSNNSPMCKGIPIQFNDQTTTNYGSVNIWHWDFGVNGISSDTSNIKNPTFNYPDTGTYTVTLIVGSDKGCIDTLFGAIGGTVTIVDKPKLTVSNDTIMCAADNLQLSAYTPSNGNYTWTPNYNISNVSSPNPIISPDVTTVYHVNYSDNYGCSNSDSVKVNVVSFVTLNVANDTTICLTDKVTLKTTGDALQYVWTPSNTLNDASAASPVATPTAPFTNYTVTANIGSCTKTSSIKVYTAPYPIAKAGNDTLICWGSSAFLHASGGSTYYWTPGSFLSSSNSANPVVNNPTSNFIDYVVTVGDVLGCPKTVKDTIRVTIDHIIADAGPRDTAVVQNESLHLYATGSINFLWTPSLWLDNAASSNPISTPKDNIQYVVRVSNSVGCFDTDTIDVRYYNVLSGFYMPKAFSPNGDGLNETLKPSALGLKSISSFRIYNRWGQLLFITSELGKGWDGRYKGKLQAVGTYIWIAEGMDYANKKIQEKGSVVLLH